MRKQNYLVVGLAVVLNFYSAAGYATHSTQEDDQKKVAERAAGEAKAEWPKADATSKELLADKTFVEQVGIRMEMAANEKSVVVFTKLMLPVLTRYKNFTPDMLEHIAREQKKNLFFIAHPVADVPKELRVTGAHDGEEKPYYVWIGVNGEKERDAKLEEIKSNKELNLKNLKNAGWLKLVKKKDKAE